MATVSASITEWTNETDGKNQYNVFKIDAECDGKKWTIERRYKEFDVLKQELVKIFGNLPPFPKKTLQPITNHNDINKRMAGLDYWVRGIINRKDMLANSYFNEFFEITKNFPNSGTNLMTMFAQMGNTNMGYRDFIYLHNKGQMFTCVSDMSALSRIDSYFTNTTLPWVNKKPNKEVLLSVGIVECLVRKTQEGHESEYVFERLWDKPNKYQVICMSWSESLNALAIGYDSGQVEVLEVDIKDPLNYKVMYSYQAHKARVMGIWQDGMRNICYTVSEDKSLKATNVKIKEIIADIKVSAAKLSCLEVCTENKIAFIADRSGQIHIYDQIPNKPVFISTITTPSKTAIRGLNIDIPGDMLFCSSFDDGFIYGYKLNFSGKKVIFMRFKQQGIQS